MTGEVWLPDGQGLSPEAAAIVARQGGPVHLRLTAPDRFPRTACGAGLGEWWTGRPGEATCTACLVAHA